LHRPSTAAGPHSPYSGSLSARRPSVSRNTLLTKPIELAATHDITLARKAITVSSQLRSRSQPRSRTAAAYGVTVRVTETGQKKSIPPASPIRTGLGTLLLDVAPPCLCIHVNMDTRLDRNAPIFSNAFVFAITIMFMCVYVKDGLLVVCCLCEVPRGTRIPCAFLRCSCDLCVYV
jgi:hypothetical protein